MVFELKYTLEAEEQLDVLSKSKNLAKRYKAVVKALRLLSANPTHPGLHTHKYTTLSGPEGAEVFEAYAESKTPAAYRIFWCYYPTKSRNNPLSTITILAITPHP